MRGWKKDVNSDNYEARVKCLKSADLDILAIAETHLREKESLSVPGYIWFGKNRSTNHVNANRGSGGVGILIKEHLLDWFDVSILDNSIDDMMWIKLKCKLYVLSAICLCVCYLPPVNSSRQVCPVEYFDKLLDCVYSYQTEGQIVLCGDFNSRIGSSPDYIEGVDSLPPRSVLDFSKNSYGDFFLDFLLGANMCVVNGRGQVDDFTSISQNGASVVDFCVVPYENIAQIQEFKVLRSRDVFTEAGCVGEVDLRTMPDHSMLTWVMSYSPRGTGQGIYQPRTACARYVKFDLKSIPEDFMCDQSSIQTISELILRLNIQDVDQEVINSVYGEFCQTIYDQMKLKIPNREVLITDSVAPKKRNKPWWNDELHTLWMEVKNAEKSWLRQKADSKLKEEFITARKVFDKAVLNCKRNYWRERQQEIQEASGNAHNFWRMVNSMGVGNERRKAIPMEIVGENGELVRDKKCCVRALEI